MITNSNVHGVRSLEIGHRSRLGTSGTHTLELAIRSDDGDIQTITLFGKHALDISITTTEES